MRCIKTGCHAYLTQYEEWVYGDAHQYGDIFIFRVAGRERTPFSPVKHFTIHSVLADWNDKPYGTILAAVVVDHGYEGVPL